MELWTTDDALKGLCQLEDVGEERPVERVPEQPEPDQQQKPPASFQPLTKAERRRLLLELSDKLLIAAHEDPTGFMGDAGPQINKFLDMAGKLDAGDAAELASTLPQQLDGMPTVELMRLFVLPILQEADEVRNRILKAWGITIGEADTLLTVVASDEPLGVR